jgi:hypothetical protein
MRLTVIEMRILIERLIDAYSYSDDYPAYVESVIVDRDSFDSVNDMISFLVKNYGKTVIA